MRSSSRIYCSLVSGRFSGRPQTQSIPGSGGEVTDHHLIDIIPNKMLTKDNNLTIIVSVHGLMTKIFDLKKRLLCRG